MNTNEAGLAAQLARLAFVDCGDPLPTWKELEEVGDVMREASALIRRMSEERDEYQRLAVLWERLHDSAKCVDRPTHPDEVAKPIRDAISEIMEDFIPYPYLK